MSNTFVIEKNDSGSRIHKWLRRNFSSFSLSFIYKSLRKKNISVNKKKVDSDYILNTGDVVKIFIKNIEIDNKKPSVTNINHAFLEKNFNIIYEDENLVAINKNGNISVHHGSKVGIGRSIIELAEQKYKTPHLVHRLDKETSGVLLIAKNGEFLRNMSEKISKKYTALVFGCFKEKTGIINKNIIKKDFGKVIEQNAITKYRVIKEWTNLDISLLEVEILTGRKHQIRIHFSGLGKPIVMDKKYGDYAKNRDFKKLYKLDRQFLHAKSVSFFHPYIKKNINIFAELPQDLLNITSILK